MSRLVRDPKASSSSVRKQDRPKKVEEKIKKVSEEVFAFILQKIDKVSLRKSVQMSRQVIKDVSRPEGAKADGDADDNQEVPRKLQGILRRIGNVNRTGQRALIDLASLADDSANGVARADGAAITRMVGDYQDDCQAVLKFGTVMVKKIRKALKEVRDAAAELEEQLKKQARTPEGKTRELKAKIESFSAQASQMERQIRSYRIRSRQMDKMFGKLNTLVSKVTANVASGASAPAKETEAQ